MRSEDEIRERINILKINYESFYRDNFPLGVKVMEGKISELEWVLQEYNLQLLDIQEIE